MSILQERHKKLAYYGVPSSGTAGYVLTRMKFFTKLTTNKNPIEHSRKYVDEESQRNDVVGYNTSIEYGFDKYTGDTVLTDIVGIHTEEKTGDQALRAILIVDTADDSAVLRMFSVIPGTEGDDANIYTYSGTFKANGEITKGTVTTSDHYATVTFTAATDT